MVERERGRYMVERGREMVERERWWREGERWQGERDSVRRVCNWGREKEGVRRWREKKRWCDTVGGSRHESREIANPLPPGASVTMRCTVRYLRRTEESILGMLCDVLSSYTVVLAK